MDHSDVLVIGAGIAGLSCARALASQGRSVRVLERSAVVGGRCASRSLEDGRVLDFGPVFIHGDDQEFLEWIEASGADLVPGWPHRVSGKGTPCQPQAFEPLQRRFGLRSGLRSLAERLAEGLALETNTEVTSLDWSDMVSAVTADGRRFTADHGVVAAALEQSRGLLATVAGPGAEAVRKADALLSQFSSLPCLSVLATYTKASPPPFDVLYPEASPSLLLVSCESAKRGGGVSLTLQARPAWSAARLEADRGAWVLDLLGDAAALLGPWVAQPDVCQGHRWRFARLGPADHLFGPLELKQPGLKAQWALTGDLFHRDGGLQGAWKAGKMTAARLAGV